MAAPLGVWMASAHVARWSRRVLAGTCLVACVCVLSLSALAVADLADAPAGYTSLRERAAWVLDRGDRLHFAVHIVAGRLLDLCPCTRAAAEHQYARAAYHAVTPLQATVAREPRASTLAAWRDYLAGPVQVGLAWLHDAVSWLDARARGPELDRISTAAPSVITAPEH